MPKDWTNKIEQERISQLKMPCLTEDTQRAIKHDAKKRLMLPSRVPDVIDVLTKARNNGRGGML